MSNFTWVAERKITQIKNGDPSKIINLEIDLNFNTASRPRRPSTINVKVFIDGVKVNQVQDTKLSGVFGNEIN